MAREVWSSKTAFVLAAIGSAIGLGNIWRFPYITYENGGGAFLVAYFACLFLAGIPLLMLEFGLGHKYAQAAPGAMKGVSKRLEFFGWFAVGVGFMIVCYYAIIMTWAVNYTYEAATLGWEQEPGQHADVAYAITTTDLEDMKVLSPVPDSLVGREFVSAISNGADVVVAGATSIVDYRGEIYAFPTREEAERFVRSPCPDETCLLSASAREDVSILDRVPDDLLGVAYRSPISGTADRIRKYGTILVAFGDHLYGFSSVDEASEFMGSPGDFFYNDFLGLTSRAWDWGTFRWPLLIGFIITWVWIVASVWKGTKTVGKVVYFTVLIPWGLLLVFIIRGVTLPGAGAGLSFYLTPDWSRLGDAKLWLAAISQVFYSLSVGFAIMIAYGSFLPKKTNIAGYAFIIGIADAMTAFCGGLAVFSALGYQASRLAVPVSEVVKSGPGLAFVAYPHIISGLPMARLFGVLFFVMLLTLAVDSAFSLLEAATAAVKDKWGWSHKRVNITIGGLAFLLGLPMLTGAGLYILDIVDHFMNSFGLTIVVLVEAIVIGWGVGANRFRDYISEHSSFRVGQWWSVCIRWIIPMGIVWMVLSELRERGSAPYGSFGLRNQEFVFGWLIIILLPIIGDLLANARGRRS
ncbi:sodium-dependent transporter [Candidatus Fermentibacterales bacterium]|nr:sodium-dependent transporter [Candidatus Fermentibacterales bacterium]